MNQIYDVLNETLVLTDDRSKVPKTNSDCHRPAWIQLELSTLLLKKFRLHLYSDTLRHAVNTKSPSLAHSWQDHVFPDFRDVDTSIFVCTITLPHMARQTRRSWPRAQIYDTNSQHCDDQLHIVYTEKCEATHIAHFFRDVHLQNELPCFQVTCPPPPLDASGLRRWRLKTYLWQVHWACLYKHCASLCSPGQVDLFVCPHHLPTWPPSHASTRLSYLSAWFYDFYRNAETDILWKDDPVFTQHIHNNIGLLLVLLQILSGQS